MRDGDELKGLRGFITWEANFAAWTQRRHQAITKKKLVRLKKPRLPSALGLSGACAVWRPIDWGLP
eukprot:scaffold20471_cov111-Isochrysis_galbana.AAC.3